MNFNKLLYTKCERQVTGHSRACQLVSQTDTILVFAPPKSLKRARRRAKCIEKIIIFVNYEAYFKV